MKPLFFVLSLGFAVTGCSVLFDESPAVPDGGSVGDGGRIDSGEGDAGVVRTLVLDGSDTYYLDTDDGSLTGAEGQTILLEHDLITEQESELSNEERNTFSIRRIQLDSLYIPSTTQLRVSGLHGLEIKVASTIAIEGDIEASSFLGQSLLGPGSDTHCPGPEDLDAQVGSERGASGGAGGPLESSGANGGAGTDSSVTSNVPNYVWRGALRGGCRGGKGAVRIGDDPGDKAAGGSGGGAVRLIAGQSITMENSAIRVSGAGGEGGKAGLHAGGGGGGSGGTVWLVAPIITLQNSILRANGGGGGEGSSACTNGQNGEDGASASFGINAAGGETPPMDVTCDDGSFAADEAGGDGGFGSAGFFGNPQDGENAENLAAGGGGGGGGAEGFVIIDADEFVVGQGGGIEPPPKTPDGQPRDG